MDLKHEKNLREEILRFVDEVKETFLSNTDSISDDKWGQFQAALKRFHDNVTTSEVLVPTLTNLFEGHENLMAYHRKLVLDRFRQTQTPAKNAKHEKCKKFLERLKSESEDTYRQVTSAMMANHKGQLGKGQLYVKICAMLIGHPGLFHLYESTLIDGSEESWRSIATMRQLAKKLCLKDVETSLKNYKDTIMAIEGSPESLTPQHLRCAADMYNDIDEEMRNKRMRDLAKNPKKLCVGAMPRLERKVTLLQDAKEKFSNYFTQIESHPI